MKEKCNVFLLCIMLFFTAIAANATQMWDGKTKEQWTKGSGTKSDPYLIETPANLAYLSAQVKDGNTYKDVYFLQTDDIDLNSKSWTLIGINSKVFAGCYDGGQKQVKNIATYLFGLIQSDTIQNLTIAGDSPYAMIYHVQGDVVLTNCHNNSTSDVKGGAGLVNIAENGSLTLLRCSNSAPIIRCYTTSVASANTYCAGYTGGLVAKANKVIAKRCSNRANIAMVTKHLYEPLYASGLIGYADYAIVEESNNNGTISIGVGSTQYGGTAYARKVYCAGIGTFKGKVACCYNMGNINAQTTSEARSCGIACSAGGGLSVSYCYSRGTSHISIINTEGGYGYKYGIAYNATCSSCYFSGYFANDDRLKGTYAIGNFTNNECYCSSNCGTANKDGISNTSSNMMKVPSFVPQLNVNGDYFYPDYTNINDGYPILRWQLEGVNFYTIKGLCREEQGSVTGAGAYPEGAEIQLTATPKDNFVFAGWSDGVADNPRTIKVEGEATYVAQFERTSYTIYVNQDCSITVE